MTIYIFLSLMVFIPIIAIIISFLYEFSSKTKYQNVHPSYTIVPIAISTLIYLFVMAVHYGNVDDKYSDYKPYFNTPDSVINQRIIAFRTVKDLDLTSSTHSSNDMIYKIDWHQTLLDVKRDSTKYRLQEEAEYVKLDAIHPLPWWAVVLLGVLNALVSIRIVMFGLYVFKSGDISNEIKKLTEKLNVPAHQVHPLMPFWKEGDIVECLPFGYSDVSYLFTKEYNQVLDMNGDCSWLSTKMKFVSFSEKGILVQHEKDGARHVSPYFVRKNITFDTERKKDVLKKMDEDSLYNAKLRILAEETYGQKV